MGASAEERTDYVTPFDAIADGLKRLRIDAGGVSYAEIASRITERRMADGVNPAAARIARSTVYDAFQRGRQRMNADLVREIVLALGQDDETGDAWRRLSLDALQDCPPDGSVPVPTTGRSSVPPPKSTEAMPSAAGAAPAPPEDARSTTGPFWDRDDIRMIRIAFIAVALAACVGLNLFGSAVTNVRSLPFWFDMIGTATASFAFGPWHGVAVALATHLFNIPLTTPGAAVFAVVNVAGALCWGFGIRWARHSVPRLMLILVGTALACALVGSAISVLLFGAETGHATDAYIALLSRDSDVWIADLMVYSVVSLADKVPTGLIGLLLASLIARTVRTSVST